MMSVFVTNWGGIPYSEGGTSIRLWHARGTRTTVCCFDGRGETLGLDDAVKAMVDP